MTVLHVKAAGGEGKCSGVDELGVSEGGGTKRSVAGDSVLCSTGLD
jgi:hypothetical protein